MDSIHLPSTAPQLSDGCDVPQSRIGYDTPTHMGYDNPAVEVT